MISLILKCMGRKQIVDHHRLLFYENIDQDFDVFVHTEDDTLIRPSNIISFMDEMEKVRLLVGDEVSQNKIGLSWVFISVLFRRLCSSDSRTFNHTFPFS